MKRIAAVVDSQTPAQQHLIEPSARVPDLITQTGEVDGNSSRFSRLIGSSS